MAKRIDFGTKPSLPKDKLEVVDQWVKQGQIEHQSQFSSNEKQQQVRFEEGQLEDQQPIVVQKMKALTLRIDEGLHKQLKLYCVNNNINITQKIVDLVMRELAENA